MDEKKCLPWDIEMKEAYKDALNDDLDGLISGPTEHSNTNT